MDRHNGRRVARITKDYRVNVVGPMVTRIKKAKSVEGLLKQLGAGCVREMDSFILEDEIAGARVQMGAIGRASALPKQG